MPTIDNSIWLVYRLAPANLAVHCTEWRTLPTRFESGGDILWPGGAT